MAAVEIDGPAGGRAPSDPRRTGRVVSGVVHAVVILWAVLGGTLFRAPPPAPSQTTEVATISEAAFQKLAAAARGAGPVAPGGDSAPDALATPAAQPPGAEAADPGPVPADPPPARGRPDPPQQAGAGTEAAPDLGDLTRPRQPVAVASVAPDALAPPPATDEPDGPAAEVAPPATVPQTAARPGAPATPDAAPVADSTPPVSALALDRSPRPRGADAARTALAEALAARQQAEAAAIAQAARDRAAAEQAASAAAARSAAAQQAESARAAEAQAAAAEAAEAARARDAEAAERRAADAAAAAEAEAARRAEAEDQARAAREAEAEAAEAARRQAEAEAAEAARRQADAEVAAAAEAQRQADEAAAAAEAQRQADAAAAESDQAEALARALAETGVQEVPPIAIPDPGPDAEAAGPTLDPDATALDPSEQAIDPAAPPGDPDALTSALADAMAGASDDTLPPVAADSPTPDATAPEQGSDPLADALAEAEVTVEYGAGGGNPDGTDDGPGLSAAEIAAFRDAVAPCWNLLPLSREARRTTVTIRLGLTPDAVPIADTIRLEGAVGGSGAAADQAFDAARRALIRCARDGYPLPLDRYERWREVVVNFHPTGLSLR